MHAGRTLRVMGSNQAETPSRWSVRHTGNRVLLGVLVAFITQFFAGLLGAEFGPRWFVGAIAGFLAYALLTGYAGSDSKR